MAQDTLGVMALYLSNGNMEDLSFFRKLSIQGEKLGLQIQVFTPEDIVSKKNLVHAHIYNKHIRKWTRKWVPIPKMIYDRCRYQKTYRFQLLKKFRANYGHLTFLNRPMMHKWGNQQLLSSSPVIADHLPDTVRYRSKEDLFRFLKKYSLVYLKPEDGTGGRGIVCIRRVKNGLYLIRGRTPGRKIMNPQLVRMEQIPLRLSSLPLKSGYIIQQGIDIALPDGRVHDFRMLIQKNGQGEWEVTGCAGRIGPPKSVTSNLHGGGSAATMENLLRRRFDSVRIGEIRGKMENLSFHVVEHLEKKFKHLCEMALDLAVDRRGNVWLLEVNPKPAREVFYQIGETKTYLTAIRRPLEYALWLKHNTLKIKGKAADRENEPLIDSMNNGDQDHKLSIASIEEEEFQPYARNSEGTSPDYTDSE